MTTDPAQRRSDEELFELIGAVLDGAATAEQHAHLGELLLADEGARRVYRRYVNLHAALRAQHATPPAAEGELASAALSEVLGSLTHDALPVCRPRVARGRRWARLLATVAGVALVVAVLFTAGRFPIRRTAEAAPIARISKLAGARWTRPADAPGLGDDLKPGVLWLADGLVEVSFRTGTRLVLEGPAEMQLLDAGSARLQRGRLVAQVPPQARGFAIETPRARVVDQGTEFGVGVRTGGDTEIQVFQGAVVATWKKLEGQTVDQRIEAGSAMQCDARPQASPQGIPFEPERFVRMFPADRDSGEPAGPLYNRSRFEAAHVIPAPHKITIDGDLSDWDRSGAFYSACFPPYHETHYVEGVMMYDDQFLYLGAHVGDPLPMRSQVAPQSNPQDYPWRGGSVIVRLCTDPSAGWPLNAAGAPEADRLGVPEAGRRPQDTSDKIVHMTLWYHQPTTAPQLHLSYGMDFHGEQAHPSGWQGAFRVDPNGQGYTLEYALPWSLLQAGNRPPRDGDVLAANWTVHWSDGDGRQSRGHLVEITNVENRPYRFLRASTWGQAIFHDRGQLPPGTVAPRE